jgi:cob(I)alamin adenosyltransferase
MGGIDLAREERIQKCDAVIEAYWELSRSKSYLKSLQRQGEIKELAIELNKVMQNFFNATKA